MSVTTTSPEVLVSLVGEGFVSFWLMVKKEFEVNVSVFPLTE